MKCQEFHSLIKGQQVKFLDDGLVGTITKIKKTKRSMLIKYIEVDMNDGDYPYQLNDDQRGLIEKV